MGLGQYFHYPMICKFCGGEMEYDSTHGEDDLETDVYTCLCGGTLFVHFDGREDSWEEG